MGKLHAKKPKMKKEKSKLDALMASNDQGEKYGLPVLLYKMHGHVVS